MAAQFVPPSGAFVSVLEGILEAGTAKMVASAVFILDAKGKVLISRNYRGDVPLNVTDKFASLVLEVCYTAHGPST